LGIHEVVYQASDGVNTVLRTVLLAVERIGFCTSGSSSSSSGKLKLSGAVGYAKRTGKLIGSLKIKNVALRQTIATTRVTSFTIGRTTAEVEADAKLNGKPGHTLRLVVEDNGPGGAADRIVECLVDGAPWSTGIVGRSGDIHFHTGFGQR
jgi:hypothetical protein